MEQDERGWMPGPFIDRFEREAALRAPAWLRFLWALWEARVTGTVWALVGGAGYARSPSDSRSALALFPSESVARDAATSDWAPAPIELVALEAAAAGDRLEVWPAFQSHYHGGVVLDAPEFATRVSQARVDVRAQLSDRPVVSDFDGFEPIPALQAVVPFPTQPPKHPRPKPAAQVRGVLGSPAANRFKYMVSTTLWLAVTQEGPLGARLPASNVALAVWSSPEYMLPLAGRDDFVAVRVGWGKDLLQPLVENGIPVIASPNDRDGLLCAPAWFVLPDLVGLPGKR